MAERKDYQLINNSRFYVLLSAVLLSLAVTAWLRLQIASDQLFYIRTQQVFGLISILYWYFALVISPIGYVIGKQRTKHLEYARRAIGVSAFYFALLHAGVALWGQLGGLEQLQYLPALFRWSLIGGLVALGILFIMAATSFDKVVKFMNFRRWKWLHRLVYIGGVLAILHIWSIGTHLSYPAAQWVALVALLVLAGLELFRVARLLNQKYLHMNKLDTITIFVTAWSVVGVLIASIPFYVQSYHSRHADNSAHGDSPRDDRQEN